MKKICVGLATSRTRKTASSPENLEKLERLIMSDRRFKLSQLAEDMGIPKTTIQSMVTQDLGMRKVSAQWVPKLL